MKIATFVLQLQPKTKVRPAIQSLYMAKILYVARVNLDMPEISGVSNKINAQKKAFERMGHQMDLVTMDNQGLLLNRHSRIADFSTSSYRLNFYLNFYRQLPKAVSAKNYDVVYVRYPRGSFALTTALKGLLKENPKLKIVLEIPTYPFDAEIQSTVSRIINFLDNRFIAQLPKYVHLVTSFGLHEQIYGIPAHSLSNGVDIDEVQMALPPQHPADELHLIAVANLAKAHAFDRLIYGMADYKKGNPEKKLIFHIVGSAEQFLELRNLAENLGLAEEVVFHGFQQTEGLNKVYDQCDMAVASLGLHRVGLNIASPLKFREYCAKGLPLLLGYNDSSMPPNFPFAFSVPHDDSPVDVEALLKFYQNLQATHPNMRQELRTFAEQNLTWDAQFRPVLERLGVVSDK